MPRKLPIVQVEVLIEEVRHRPILYDSKSIEHKDTLKVYEAWSSIHGVMAREFGTGVQQAHDGLYWKKKWRNLRDVYVKKRREIRSPKSCESAERAKKWSYLEIMNFLDGYIEESVESYVPAASDSDEMSNTQSEGEINSSIASIYRSSIQLPGQMNTSSNGLTPVTSTTSQRGTTKRKHENTNLESPRTEFIHETTTSKQNVDRQMMCCRHKDADDMFFDSCALRFKKLPATTRSFLQLQVSQLFFNAENPQMPQVQITPLPPTLPVTQPSCVLTHPQPYVDQRMDGSSEQFMPFEQKPEL